MVLAYCTRCKEKTELKNPQTKTLENGRHYMSGECSVCGKKNGTFISSVSSGNGVYADLVSAAAATTKNIKGKGAFPTGWGLKDELHSVLLKLQKMIDEGKPGTIVVNGKKRNITKKKIAEYQKAKNAIIETSAKKGSGLHEGGWILPLLGMAAQMIPMDHDNAYYHQGEGIIRDIAGWFGKKLPDNPVENIPILGKVSNILY